MFGKCIKVVNGIFFLLVIVFDDSMNQEVVEQLLKVKINLFIEVLIFYFCCCIYIICFLQKIFCKKFFK